MRFLVVYSAEVENEDTTLYRCVVDKSDRDSAVHWAVRRIEEVISTAGEYSGIIFQDVDVSVVDYEKWTDTLLKAAELLEGE